MGNGNLQKKPRFAEPKKLASGFYVDLLRKIAAAFRIDLSEQTLAVYVEALWAIDFHAASEDALRERFLMAANRVIQEWGEPSKMPTPKFIIDRFLELNAPSSNSSENYDRMVEEYKRRNRAELPHVEIPEGVDPVEFFRQRLEKVSSVKTMDAPGQRSLHEYHRAVALERLGGTTQPVQRKPGTTAGRLIEPEMLNGNREWARKMAIKNGWIETREPGAEG